MSFSNVCIYNILMNCGGEKVCCFTTTTHFHLFLQTLSVTILDSTLKTVRRQFEGNDLIRNVPLHKTVGDALRYVSEHYFDPPLGLLETL